MIYLVGAGGHGRVVLETLQLSGCQVRLLDADSSIVGRQVLGHKVVREEKVLFKLEEEVDFFVGVGDCASRRRVVERWEARGHRLVRVIHPSAVVSRSAKVEAGVAVMAGAVIQAQAVVEKGAIINTGATVDHDCRVGEFAHIAPGTNLAGNVEVGSGAWIGIGSVVREGIQIGRDCVVGAGSVVLDDLPPAVVAYGNPCRIVRQIGKGD